MIATLYSSRQVQGKRFSSRFGRTNRQSSPRPPFPGVSSHQLSFPIFSFLLLPEDSSLEEFHKTSFVL
jgi:hypothetical protein